jgi:glutamyl-tRNA synthetase
VATARAGLAAARATIEGAGDAGFTVLALEPALRALADARGWKAGDLFMAIRVAISGRTATPPLFESMVALGRERTLARLERAADALAG